MKQKFKRIGSMLLVLAMLLSLFPGITPTAYAAGSLNTITGLTADWTDASNKSGSATWSASGTSITGTATGYKQNGFLKKTVTTTLTLTNSSGSEATLSFEYTLEGGGSVSSSDSKMSGTGGSYSGVLPDGASLTITLTSPKGTSTNTLSITGLSLISTSAADVTTTFKPAVGGSYTVNSEEITAKTSKTDAAGTEYTVSATAASGYIFFGWYNETTDAYLDYSDTYTFKASADMTLVPMFVADTTAVFGVGTAKFTDLTEAGAYAADGSVKTIVLLNGGTVSGSHTIPAGTTLLIPFDDANTLYTTTPETTSSFNNNVAWVKPTAYRTLTLAADADITVNGAISLSAKHAAGGGSAGNAGSPTGPCSFMNMTAGSHITLNSGAALYAWGFVTGSGTITAKSGSSVYENFQVRDFRGGSATSAMAKDGLVFPLSQYYVQNVEVPITYESGAEEYVYTSLYMSKMVFSASVKFVGEGAMFQPQAGGSVTKTYIGSSDRLRIDVRGDATLSSIQLSISTTKIDSASYILPLNSNIDINILSGTTSLYQDLALLPGSGLSVAEGATLSIPSTNSPSGAIESGKGYNLFVYDADEWTYGFDSDLNRVDGLKYVHSGYRLMPLSYAPGRNYKRTEADLKDVVVDVNGTITTNGFLYTTAGGASIISSGKTGQIVMANGAGTEEYTYQATQSGSDITYYAIPVNSAFLKNGSADHPYTDTSDAAAGDTYVYNANKDMWVKDGEIEEITITFNANGGDGSMDPQTVESGADAVLNNNTFTREHYTFGAWNTQPDGEGIVYRNGATVNFTENTTLYAIWEPETYTVTWKNGETVLKTETLLYGATPSYSGTTPTKAADAQYTYSFSGWVDGEGNALTADTTVTGDVTYTAEYTSTVNTYTVTWKNEDGTVLETDENVPYGTTPKYDGATPTKAATAQYTYTFKGWTPKVSAVTGNVTYTAEYTSTVNTYTVTWKNGETVLKTETLPYGATPKYEGETPTKAADAQYTYTFKGWTPEITEVTGNVTYTAEYTSTVNTYTVTWKNGDGTVLKTETLSYGAMPSYSGTTPTKAADAQYTYTFKGWTPEITEVTGNVTYTAEYTSTVNTYTVTWKNGDTVLKTETLPYGATPEYEGETPTKAADAQYTYTFKGWTPEITEVTGNVTYTAEYTSTVNTYTVTWKNADGTVLETDTNVAYGTTPSYDGETPTKEMDDTYRYSFKGWDAELSPVKGDVTYTAQFEATARVFHTVTFYPNGGEGEAKTQKFEQGFEQALAANDFTREGYTFTGWNTAISGGGQAYKDSAIISIDADMALFAQWQINTYTVIWLDENGKELEKDENVEYGSVPTYNGEKPTKAADAQYTYTFKGWEDENGVLLTTDTRVTGNVTYKAVFDQTVNQYTITWLNGDGDTLKSEWVAYGATPVYSGETPTKTMDSSNRYTFNGTWSPAITSVSGNATYTAQFDATARVFYTVTFNANNGEGTMEAQTIEQGYEAELNKNTFTREGYDFTGWNTAADGQGTGYNDQQLPTGLTDDITLYAQWQIKTFTVTWVNDDGTVLETDENVPYGTNPTYNGDTPTKAGNAQYTYTFKTWTPNVSAVTGDVTYKAVYDQTVNQYTITWKNWDGTVLKTERVAYDTVPSYTGELPTKAADAQYTYYFEKWTPDVVAVTEDAVYTAVYTNELRTYTVTWLQKSTDGGEDTVLETDENVPYGARPEYNSDEPIKTGNAQFSYSFSGWQPAVTEDTIVTGDVTFVAQFEATVNQYTITWKDWDGTALKTEQVAYGEKPVYTGTEPTRAEDDAATYTFSGWTPAITEETTVTGDAAYTADYTATPKSYTITFKDGETLLKESEVQYGATPVYEGTPTKESTVDSVFTFKCWTNEAGEELEILPAVTGNAVYYAKFTSAVREYSITWMNEDGTMIKSEQLGYGTVIRYTGDTPAKAGNEQFSYRFAGWKDAAGIALTDQTTVTGDAVYTAQFDQLTNTYTVTWKNADGTVLETDENVPFGTMPSYDGKTPTKTATAQYTYTFKCWTPKITEVAGNVTYTAEYTSTVNTYTVTWKNYDGSVLKEQLVAYNEMPEYIGEIPQKPMDDTYRYSFNGKWDPEVQVVTGPAEYTAQFDAAERKFYTVSFDANGGSGEMASQTMEKGYEVALTENSFERQGYIFTGWNTNPNGYGTSYNDKDLPTGLTVDTTLYAQWQAKTYTITWQNYDGTTLETDYNVPYDTLPTYDGATPTKAADERYTYSFDSWTPAVSTVTGDATYTATFTPTLAFVFVTFDANGGEGSMDKQSVQYAVDSTLNPNLFTRENYRFVCWNTEKDGTGDTYSDRQTINLEEDITLYAQWRFWNGWFTDNIGTTYFVEGVQPYHGAWATIDGSSYYFDEDSYIVKGLCKTTSQDGSHEATFVFDDETGIFLSNKSGLHDSGTDTYWIHNGEVVEYAGLVRVVKDDGEVNYYYFGEDSKAIKGIDIWVEKTNDLLPQWGYYFDENGVILHDPDTSKNGIVEDEGVKFYYIDGIKVHMGLFKIGEDYYYAKSNGQLIVNATYYCSMMNGLLPEGPYAFDEEGKMIIPEEEEKNGIVAENGSLYYYVDGKLTYGGLIQIDGSYYYVRGTGEVVHGQNYWITKTNDIMPQGSYTFADDGKMVIPEEPEMKNGIVAENGSLYYYVDGKLTYGGLIQIDGDYYYIRGTGEVVHGQNYWITKTNDLMPEGSYTFADDGKMVIPEEPEVKNGIVAENGSLYYYVDGKLTYGGLIQIDGDYYYVRGTGEVVHGRAYWITKTNDLMPQGSYTFADDGKMVLPAG